MSDSLAELASFRLTIDRLAGWCAEQPSAMAFTLMQTIDVHDRSGKRSEKRAWQVYIWRYAFDTPGNEWWFNADTLDEISEGIETFLRTKGVTL